MLRSADEIEELKNICPAAQEMSEAGIAFVVLPGLKLPNGATADALLCPQTHGGYTTRLFLSSPVSGKGQNWSTHTILSRVWYTWSWNNVSADQRLAEILAQHLRALR